MSIAARLTEDMKAALRAGNKLELGALRMALAAFKRKEIDERKTLTDDAALGVLEKLIKQGRDAEQQFESAGRAELAAKEAAEIAVFERYMPHALGEAELEALIRQTVEATGAAGVKDMGKVMAAIKAEAAGRADMAAVSARVREILTAG
jgi:uncharacterized protein YqeY